MKKIQQSVQMPSSEIFTIPGSTVSAEMINMESSADIFDEDDDLSYSPVPGYQGEEYVNFGSDNQLPFEIIKMIGRDEVMSQNKLFNVLTCYGAGQKYMDYDTEKPTKDKDIKRWMLGNNLASFMLEQATDMKYFFFAVSVIILSKDGTRINKLRHKEACYCRFQRPDKQGRIKHVYYANWRLSGLKPEQVERISLLDINDPFGELEMLMGRAPGADG